jgi:hypothetical protein
LEWVHAPAVVGTPFTDGTWAVLHRDVEGTATALENLHPGDGDAWMAMYRQWEVIGDQVMGALLSPFPPIRHGLAAATKLPVVGGMSFLRMLTAPVRTMAGQHFGGRAAHMLLAGNAAHADSSSRWSVSWTPRVLSTLDAVEQELSRSGLVQRWTGSGGEGAFVICSYWLATARAMAGQVERAKEIFDAVTVHANDLGLLAEEIDIGTGAQLGNFPQGLSHIGLINAAWEIAKADKRRTEQSNAHERRQ